jgi:uncharacterized Zn finger protein
MSYDDFYDWQKPIKTKAGIKAKSKRGDFVKNWWASRWLQVLEGLIDAGRLRRGQRYARQGQVLSVEETKTGIKAKVQGSQRTPYRVTINLAHLNAGQWQQVIDALAEQAIFSAQLLAGEMPQEIETAFEAAGASLFPTRKEELETKCTCPDPAIPCKHVAAVHHLLGEQFDEDPFLLFRLRGRSPEQILAALRKRRAAGEAGRESDGETETEPEVLPLAAGLNRFWELGEPLDHFKSSIKPPVTPLPVLRRLGQPTFLNDDIIELLGPVYQGITDEAVTTAFEDSEAETD